MNGILVHDEIDEHGGIIKHITGVDLSNDTVSAETLLKGETAHDREGNEVIGELEKGSYHNAIGDTVVVGGEIELESNVKGETCLTSCTCGQVGMFSNIGTYEHDKLIHRDYPNQHPIDAITDLRDILNTLISIDDISLIYCGTSTEVI